MLLGYLGKNTLFFSGVIYIKIHIEDKKTPPKLLLEKEK